MIKIGIIGGAGYTAGELLRILLHHPKAKIQFIHSNSNAGNLIADVHMDLLGETDLRFTSELDFSGVDVLFLCVGHGEAKVFVEQNNIPKSVKIIDLSQDFRIKGEHDYIYGLPELNKKDIKKANYIANPGCFATTIQLAVLPLAKAKLIKDDIHVHAITGSTGAGQKPTDTSHFSWRNNNISIYEAFKHRHLKEINQSIRQLQKSYKDNMNFLPVRGNFTRGIYASVYTKCNLTLEEAKKLYTDFYANDPFTVISDKNPNLKQVVNTNKCLLYLEKSNDKLLIISMIDNLIKGASGQAVQNMNLMFGLNETIGLGLKASYF